MRIVNIILCIALALAFLNSCQKNSNEVKDYTEEKNMLSKAKLDTNERQFVCKASIEMQVKNCLSATDLIEQKAIEQKGFILKSEVKKNNTNLSETEISIDSAKQTQS
jgi:hypothetical protein